MSTELACPAATRQPVGSGHDLPFSPDPVLSANIYCAGALDTVIYGAVAPFWEAHGEGHERGLWMLRYGCGGEHLKVRLHAPLEAREEFRDGLRIAVESCFTNLGEVPAKPRRAPEPPIDAEDEIEAHPDRCLLWTTYRRHPISLGGETFHRDAGYCAYMTRCLARGCELVLAASEPGATGQIPHARRQNVLIRLLLDGLAALDLGVERCVDYLAYHRDNGLRTVAAFNAAKPEAVRGVLEQIDARARGMNSVRETLAGAAAASWKDGSSASAEHASTSEGAWHTALAELFAYNTALCEDPAYHLDPHTADPTLAVLVKVFQGLSNPLGLTLLDLSFALHLLLSAVAPERAAEPPHLPTLEHPEETAP